MALFPFCQIFRPMGGPTVLDSMILVLYAGLVVQGDVGLILSAWLGVVVQGSRAQSWGKGQLRQCRGLIQLTDWPVPLLWTVGQEEGEHN